MLPLSSTPPSPSVSSLESESVDESDTEGDRCRDLPLALGGDRCLDLPLAPEGDRYRDLPLAPELLPDCGTVPCFPLTARNRNTVSIFLSCCLSYQNLSLRYASGFDNLEGSLKVNPSGINSSST